MSPSRKAMGSMFALLVIVGLICGTNAKAPSRIQEGQTANEGEFPGVVALTYAGGPHSRCGGAIISPRHVLTAGHCIDPYSRRILKVRAGICDNRDKAVELLAEKVVVHPDYAEQTKSRAVQNDIAIVVLKDALPLGPRIQPLMLPLRPPTSGVSYAIAGWGRGKPPQDKAPYQRSTKLQWLVMKIDTSKCPGQLPQKFCAHSDTGSTCNGDSGSPLMKDGYVYGIDSTGFCRITASTYFMNVYHYVSWIESVMIST